MLQWVLAAVLLVSAQAAGDSSDLTALTALKNSISNWDEVANSPGFYGWEGTDPCSGPDGRPWVGVLCVDPTQPGRVSQLMLSILAPGKIQGSLPAELDQLTAASLVDVIGQSFTSSLPESWGTNGGFASLQQLNLGQNQLQSSLPEQWGSADRFQKLQALQLYGNQLSGSVPESWGSQGAFPALKVLSLSSNQLSGDLPQQWGDHQQLDAVDVSNNADLSGAIPSAWATLKSIWRAIIVGEQPVSTLQQPEPFGALEASTLLPEPSTALHSRSLLQLSKRCSGASGVFGGADCTVSEDGNTNSFTSTSGNQEDKQCQTSADGRSVSCSYSSSSSTPGSSSNSVTSSSSDSSRGFWGTIGAAATSWWVWVLAVLLAAVALYMLARRRNVYVMLRGDSQSGLPRFYRNKDNKEAELS